MKKIEDVQAKLNEFDLVLCNSDSVLKNKFLCSNSSGSLTWYYNLDHLNPEVIVHSDTASGCGYSLNTETITVREAPSVSGGFFLHFLLRDKSNLQLFKKLATDLIENSNFAFCFSQLQSNL